jgi:penicillin-binding protein 2
MNRLILPRIIALLIFVALVGRLYQLQLVDTEANKYRYATQVLTARFLPVRPIRGEIFAADGKTLLAESVPIYSASIRPADLPDPTTAAHERAAVFAQLGQLLGISTTLTISPVLALDQDPALRNDLIQGLGPATLASAQHQSSTPPLRFTTAPAQSIEAATLATRYRAVAQFQITGAAGQADDADSSGQPNAAPEPSQAVTLALTGTLTISPAAALQQNPTLRADLDRLLGHEAVEAFAQPATLNWATLTVPPARSMVAFKLSETYTSSLLLSSPIAAQVARANVPGYQTIIVKQDIPRAVALVLRENAASLPGVAVELDYRRRYPLSEQVQSFSHMLGYIGRVDECDLARSNPARSWMMSLLESVSHAAECGFVKKQISPTSLGIAQYLNDDRIGKDGLEGSYEQDLRGQLGMESILVDALNRPVRAPEVVQPARDGDNLILTLDAGFQRQVEQILRNWIAVGEQRRLQQSGVFVYKRDYKPIRSGVAIVMEVRTGRVLAMVSWPAYDNNIWDPARSKDLANVFAPSDPEAKKEMLRLAPLVNHAIAGQYPPGSTLKQFDASIALQAGVITPDTKIHDAGRLLLEGQFDSSQTFPYVNAGSRAYGDITVRDALRVSSNIFFMSVVGGNSDHVINLTPEQKNIEDGLGITRFNDGLSMFGFGQATGIRLSGELKGRVPTPKWKQEALLQAWTTGDTYNVAIGQGNLEVTPLQLITAGVAVANNGDLYQPQIVKAVTDSSGNIRQEVPPQLVRHIDIDPHYFAVVREGMRSSVTDGPNVAARDACSGLTIAGKTGTAEYGPEILVPTNDGRSTHLVRQSHSWFVGFAPYDNPEIEVLALVEGTGDLGDGSATIAVPAVTQIMQAYFKTTPPNPLPRECQQDLPPLPARIDPSAPTGTYVRSGPGR